MKLPKDKVMLLSVINTGLRDKYTSLEEMARVENFNSIDIINSLAEIGYSYNSELNKFI